MSCPECVHELRPINSLGINLCDSCGYREKLPAIAVPPPKKRKVNYLPMAVMIGVCGLAIAAMAGTTAQKIAEERKIEAARIKAEAAMERIDAYIEENKGVDISTLPDFCQPTKYQQLNYEMYLHCFPEKMTYSQVNQITGMPGEIVSNSGGTKVMQFIGRGDYSGYGYMAIVFQGDRLVSKSQANLIRH